MEIRSHDGARAPSSSTRLPIVRRHKEASVGASPGITCNAPTQKKTETVEDIVHSKAHTQDTLSLSQTTATEMSSFFFVYVSDRGHIGVLILDMSTKLVFKDSISVEHLEVVFHKFPPLCVVCNSHEIQSMVPHGVRNFLYAVDGREDEFMNAETGAHRLANMHFMRKVGHGVRAVQFHNLPACTYDHDTWKQWSDWDLRSPP